MVLRLMAAVVAAGCLASPVRANEGFWFGEDLRRSIGPDDAATLQATLQGSVVPKLQQWFMAYPAAHAYPTGVLRYAPGKTWDGYTLLTSLSGDPDPSDPTNPDKARRAILIDMYGAVVQEWSLTGIPAKMLPGGYVIAGQGRSGTASRSLVEQDFCGNEVWRWDGLPGVDPTLGARWHHDFEREGSPVGYYAPGARPNPLGGKTLVLANFDPPFEATQHISAYPLYDDAIYEIDWDGNVVFEWHAFEHFEEMGFDQAAREGIMNTCLPGGVPTCRPGAVDPRTDWTHMNSVSWLGPNRWFDAGDCRFDPDFVIWDARSMNLSAIVATHDCVRGDHKKGDVVWRIGPDYGFGSPDHALGPIIGQHQVHMIPAGLPGAGNILIFDNGGFGGFGALIKGLPGTWPNTFRDTSRVLEVDPVTKRIVWEYSVPRPGDKEFFSTLISGAQRLRNGNTLITEGGTGRVFEVTRAGEIVWEYVSPFTGAVAGGGGFIGPNGVYRAYRVPAAWLPKGFGAGWECPPNGN